MHNHDVATSFFDTILLCHHARTSCRSNRNRRSWTSAMHRGLGLIFRLCAGYGSDVDKVWDKCKYVGHRNAFAACLQLQAKPSHASRELYEMEGWNTPFFMRTGCEWNLERTTVIRSCLAGCEIDPQINPEEEESKNP